MVTISARGIAERLLGNRARILLANSTMNSEFDFFFLIASVTIRRVNERARSFTRSRLTVLHSFADILKSPTLNSPLTINERLRDL